MSAGRLGKEQRAFERVRSFLSFSGLKNERGHIFAGYGARIGFSELFGRRQFRYNTRWSRFTAGHQGRLYP
jgi:hypothetical protein